MSKSEFESERQRCPFTRKCFNGEWVRENKNLLSPPQKITATEKLLYISVYSHGFNLQTCSNYSYSRLIYVWQFYIKKMLPLPEQHPCLQAGRGEYYVFRCKVHWWFGQTFIENFFDKGCTYWYFLICSSHLIFCFLLMKMRNVALIRGFFHFVSQGFFGTQSEFI